ncbi:MAG: LysE family transporter [Armatimonadota bacterium]
MIAVFFLSLLVGFSGALMPGPMFAVTVQQALLVGWSVGLWISIGHVLAELALFVALRFGLGDLLTRRTVTRVISVVGGAVLLYLAWGMFQTALHGVLAHGASAKGAMTYGKLIGQGAILSLTNPTWHVWWATVGIGLIASQIAKHGRRAWPVFFVGHTLADFIWYVGLSTIIAMSGSFFNERLHRGLILLCAAGVTAIGVKFLLQPIIEWWRGRRLPPTEVPADEPVTAGR